MNSEQLVQSMQMDGDKEELIANFNAILYLLTEQMGINLALLDLLVEKGILTQEEANEKVLSVTGDKSTLTHVYQQLYGRFINYYGAVREMIEKGSYYTPAQNSANPEETTNE